MRALRELIARTLSAPRGGDEHERWVRLWATVVVPVQLDGALSAHAALLNGCVHAVPCEFGTHSVHVRGLSRYFAQARWTHNAVARLAAAPDALWLAYMAVRCTLERATPPQLQAKGDGGGAASLFGTAQPRPLLHARDIAKQLCTRVRPLPGYRSKH